MHVFTIEEEEEEEKEYDLMFAYRDYISSIP